MLIIAVFCIDSMLILIPYAVILIELGGSLPFCKSKVAASSTSFTHHEGHEEHEEEQKYIRKSMGFLRVLRGWIYLTLLPCFFVFMTLSFDLSSNCL